MNAINLSKRLNKVAEFVSLYGEQPIRLADIGSDHAYLPCNLLLNNKIDYAIAGEVVEGPFKSAQAEVNELELNDKIDVRLGDGLEVVSETDEINLVTICGMGGILIRDILNKGFNKLVANHYLVLQPNMAEQQLREWLVENHYIIIAETIISEQRHFYEIIVAQHQPKLDKVLLSAEELLFGPRNLKAQNSVFCEKWTAELTNYKRILQGMAQATTAINHKKAAMQQKIKMIEKVLEND